MFLALECALGKRLALASSLGYSERQYYNIPRRAKSGLPLRPRLEAFLRLKLTEIEMNQAKEALT